MRSVLAVLGGQRVPAHTHGTRLLFFEPSVTQLRATRAGPILTRVQHAGHPYASFAPSGKVWVQLVQRSEQLEDLVTAIILLCFDPVRGRTFACRV